MKHNWKIFRQYIPFLLPLPASACLCALFLWLADVQAFHALAVFMVSLTILLSGVFLSIVCFHENRKQKAFLNFLSSPDEYNEQALLHLSGAYEGERIRLIAALLRKDQDSCRQLQSRIEDYEEYVEAWAHEIKTPVSLLAMIIDNQQDSLPLQERLKLDYVRGRLQESVNQMLYYARLKNACKDYLFESINLSECLEEILEDYRPVMEEKKFRLTISVPAADVYSDRRGLNFLISQLISNSVKYTKPERNPELAITFVQEKQYGILSVRDNGTGIRSSDLPYIFEKGFTGDSGENRRRATGMGLYLAKEMARDLNLRLEAASEWGKGFEMKIYFPC